MTGTKVVTGQLHRVQRGRGKGFASEPPVTPARRPARVAVMLALARQIQRAIDRGKLADQAEAARRLGLTRARVTQPLDLTLLAPEIQEQLLGLEFLDAARTPSERTYRGIDRSHPWPQQRAGFEKLSVRLLRSTHHAPIAAIPTLDRGASAPEERNRLRMHKNDRRA